MEKPERPNISLRTNPSGQRIYRLDYKDPFTGKRVRKVVGSIKRDAEKMADKNYREWMARYVGEPERTITEATIEFVIEAYFTSKANRIRPNSNRRYRIYTDNFLNFMSEYFPTITMITQVKRSHLEEFFQYLFRNGQSPGTINAELRLLRSIFKLGVNEGILLENPSERIERFKVLKKAEEVKFWSIEEVQAILNEVQPHWRDAYEFLYLTGLRKGELIHLTWDTVILDEENPKIKIQAQEGWVPKTSQRREVPLNSKAVEILMRQTKSDEHNFLFKGYRGGKINENRIYDCLKSALKRLNLDGNLHKFRHTFSSHLVMAGIGLETVSKLLGHSSIEMTMKYAHLAPDHLQKAVEVLVEPDED